MIVVSPVCHNSQEPCISFCNSDRSYIIEMQILQLWSSALQLFSMIRCLKNLKTSLIFNNSPKARMYREQWDMLDFAMKVSEAMSGAKKDVQTPRNGPLESSANVQEWFNTDCAWLMNLSLRLKWRRQVSRLAQCNNFRRQQRSNIMPVGVGHT